MVYRKLVTTEPDEIAFDVSCRIFGLIYCILNIYAAWIGLNSKVVVNIYFKRCIGHVTSVPAYINYR